MNSSEHIVIPASVSQKREIGNMRDQLDKLLQQLQEQGKQSRDKQERMERKMEQQRNESIFF